MASKVAPAKTADTMLKRIDEFLARGGDEAGKLWNVLTALRGPDDSSIALKRATTARIRTLAFPRAARSSRARVQLLASFSTARDAQLLKVTDTDGSSSFHFDAHFHDAYFTLRAMRRLRGPK